MRAKFGAVLEAFEYGAPPHGGIALGIDRWAMIFASQTNIREVMAFPKTQSGIDPMLEAPSAARPGQLAELGLRFVGVAASRGSSGDTMIDEGDGGDPQDPGGPDRPRDGIAEQVGAKRPTSYSEQYQGTEFGRPAPPPPSPPPSRRPFAVAAIAVIAILVAGSALVVLAVAPNGVGSIGSRPSVPPSGSTERPVRRLRRPRLTPTIDPGTAVTTRFWTLVSAPDASYHLAAKGKSVFDGKTYETFRESIDIVG